MKSNQPAGWQGFRKTKMEICIQLEFYNTYKVTIPYFIPALQHCSIAALKNSLAVSNK